MTTQVLDLCMVPAWDAEEFATLVDWNASPEGAKHPKDAQGRWAKGSAVGRALKAGESIAHFSREALQREVRKRNRDGAGIQVRRGASADEIRAALTGGAIPQAPKRSGGDNPKIVAARERQARIDEIRRNIAPAVRIYGDMVSGLPATAAKLDEADRLFRENGVRPYGLPETVFKFDRSIHQPISGQGATDGQLVTSVRPGVWWDEENRMLDKAAVTSTDPEQEIADYWKDQEVDVYKIMKAREAAWARGDEKGGKEGGKPTLAEVTGKPKASNRNTVAAAQKIYGGTFAGLNVKVSEATITHSNSMVIAGDITNAEGHRVGTFTRTIHGKPPHATHGSFYLQPKVQGQGFAEAWNANAIGWYRNNGVKSIHLYAGDDVGGYAWAVANYDFADKATAQKIMLRVLAAVEPGSVPDTARVDANMKRIPPERLAEQQKLAGQLFDRSEATEFGSVEYPTPYEISQLGRQPGDGKDDMWIGKAIMLGSSWKGVRYL